MSPALGITVEPASTRASLLSRVRDPGDDGAWQEFVSQYGDLILRYALSRGLQYCDAEDVRQVVLMHLSCALREFRFSPQRGRFRDYLGVAARRAVQEFKSCPKETRRPLSIDWADDAPADNGSDGLWEREWVSHHYRLALGVVRTQVEPRSIEVFERLLGGASVAEAAAEFGLSPEAVEKVRQRIRERLRAQVAQQVRQEDSPDE